MRSTLSFFVLAAFAGLVSAAPKPDLDLAKCTYLRQAADGTLVCTSSAPGAQAKDVQVVDPVPVAPIAKRQVDFSKCLYLMDVDGVLTCTSSPPGEAAKDLQTVDAVPIAAADLPVAKTTKRSIRHSTNKKMKRVRASGDRLVKRQ